jgi:WXG100 family type VII secretion target
MGYSDGSISARTEEVSSTGSQLSTFAETLQGYIDTAKSVVDTIVEDTEGAAKTTLDETFYDLYNDLAQYVTDLDTLGSNVQTSASNMEMIDSTASGALTYK